MPWSTLFDEPLRPRGGRELSTLQHAADYIMKLPEAVQQQELWQVAVENLINAAGDRRWLADVRANRGDAGNERREIGSAISATY